MLCMYKSEHKGRVFNCLVKNSVIERLEHKNDKV